MPFGAPADPKTTIGHRTRHLEIPGVPNLRIPGYPEYGSIPGPPDDPRNSGATGIRVQTKPQRLQNCTEISQNPNEMSERKMDYDGPKEHPGREPRGGSGGEGVRRDSKRSPGRGPGGVPEASRRGPGGVPGRVLGGPGSPRGGSGGPGGGPRVSRGIPRGPGKGPRPILDRFGGQLGGLWKASGGHFWLLWGGPIFGAIFIALPKPFWDPFWAPKWAQKGPRRSPGGASTRKA